MQTVLPDKLTVATRLLAGLLANPDVVFGDYLPGPHRGNATELVESALYMADKLLEKAAPEKAP